MYSKKNKKAVKAPFSSLNFTIAGSYEAENRKAELHFGLTSSNLFTNSQTLTHQIWQWRKKKQMRIF